MASLSILIYHTHRKCMMLTLFLTETHLTKYFSPLLSNILKYSVKWKIILVTLAQKTSVFYANYSFTVIKHMRFFRKKYKTKQDQHPQIWHLLSVSKNKFDIIRGTILNMINLILYLVIECKNKITAWSMLFPFISWSCQVHWESMWKTEYRVRETMFMPFNSNVKSIYILKWQEKTSL